MRQCHNGQCREFGEETEAGRIMACVHAQTNGHACKQEIQVTKEAKVEIADMKEGFQAKIVGLKEDPCTGLHWLWDELQSTRNENRWLWGEL